jgi:hypothetical protein
MFRLGRSRSIANQNPLTLTIISNNHQLEIAIATMEAADSSGIKPTASSEAAPPAAALDRTASATAASNVMSSLAGLGSTSSEEENEKDVGGTLLKEPSSYPLPPNAAVDMDMRAASGSYAAATAIAANDSSIVANKSVAAGGSDAMEVEVTAASIPATTGSFSKPQPPSSTSPLSTSKSQQSAKTKARGMIPTPETSGESAFAAKPAALPTAAVMATGDKKKKKDKDDKKKTIKKKSAVDGKKGKEKIVKKKKVRL